MRKFIYAACMAGLFVVQSFAQPRDLFAEFEAEAEAAEQSSVEQSSAAVASSSSATPAPVSSAAVSSAAVPASSVTVVSSSSVAPVAVSSSSEKAAMPALSAGTAEVSSSSVAASSSATHDSAVVAPVVVADSSVAQPDSVESDSAAVDSAETASSSSMTPEEAYAAEMRRHNEENRIRDSLAMLSSSSVEKEAPSSSSMSRRELLGPVKVSKVNGIDEMKGRYKSPRKAMFLSLVIPGSGQLYVGGSNFIYARGAVYLALEAALWGSWYYYSVYKYDKQVDRYKKYAKNHYSIGRYEREMRDLYNADGWNYESEFRRRYLGSRESFCEGIFGDAKRHGCYDRDKLYHNDVDYVNDFVANPKSLGDEMKSVKMDNPSEIYQLIADNAYVLGWDDVEDPAVATALGLEDPNSSTVSLGKSAHQKEYRSMRGKANDYADMQAWFFGGLILNHLVSAVDALFAANAHNKALYEEDLSWYDHLRFDSGISFADGFGVNVQASWGF